jgi:hypothetical protein
LNSKEILIRKASGEEEKFDVTKLEGSLHNAGASRIAIKQVVAGIEEWLFEGVSTKQLYSKAFSLLRKAQKASAIRYNLKKAIYQLGPSGYPFESFIGQVFDRLNYKTETGIIVEGHCLSHEMDVIATNETEQFIIECKYHKDQGKHVSVQVPLYVKSRVDDIIKKRENSEEYSGLKFSSWVVTNTRFSTDAIQFARCSGVRLLAWDFPKGKGLKELIEQVQIFPVTILSKLLKKDKITLLEKGIVSCRQLCDQKEVLEELNLTPRKKKVLLEELEEICS